MKNYIVAIDGPAASGKSTTARLVAQQLGWLYVDTGAMYRAVTLAVLRSGVPIDRQAAVEEAAGRCTIAFEPGDDGQRVVLNGEDVSADIRRPDVTAAVSKVSSYAGVRERMVALQRACATHGSLVMDGRDIGTVVFPEADVKVFLIASIEERARRRQAELKRNGTDVGLDALTREIEERDRFDASRANSPLRKAADAVELDTTDLTIEAQVRTIIRLVESSTGVKART